MAKFVRSFGSRAAAKAFVKTSREKFRCINYGCVYQSYGHYHAMLSGDITPEIAEQLRGRIKKSAIFQP